MDSTSATPRKSSDPIARPGNPVLRRRSLSMYRNSLCLVDDGTGEVVQVLQSEVRLPELGTDEVRAAQFVPLAHKASLIDLPATPNMTPIRRAVTSSPPSPAPTTPPISPSPLGLPPSHDHATHRDHSKDTPGGLLAHKVDGIVRSIHPRDRDSDFEPENPDWSGDSDTGLYLLHLNRALREGETMPPLEEWATARAVERAAQRDGMHSARPASPEVDAASSGYKKTSQMKGELLASETRLDKAGSPVGIVPGRQASEAISDIRTHTPIREEADDVLLEFLGKESTIRVSRICARPGTEIGDPRAPQPLAHLAAPVAVAEGWTSFISSLVGALSSIALFKRLAALADWTRGMPAALVDDAERLAAIDSRMRSAEAQQRGRMSVVYFDNRGRERRVLMHRR